MTQSTPRQPTSLSQANAHVKFEQVVNEGAEHQGAHAHRFEASDFIVSAKKGAIEVVGDRSTARFMSILKHPPEGRRPWLQILDSLALKTINRNEDLEEATEKKLEPCKFFVVEIIEGLDARYRTLSPITIKSERYSKLTTEPSKEKYTSRSSAPSSQAHSAVSPTRSSSKTGHQASHSERTSLLVLL